MIKHFSSGFTVAAAAIGMAILAPIGFATIVLAQPSVTPVEIGVLMASHGDIDDIKVELQDYIKTAFAKNVGIPFPYWIRPALSEPAYLLSVNKVSDQYRMIGPTHYRANSASQVAAVTAQLQKLGLNARAYVGFNFARPLIEETLARMQADGIKKFVVFNKGAQYSFASSGENIGDVRQYLLHHPEWNVEAIGFHQYSEDQRFREVWARAIERDVQRFFSSWPTKDVCILLGSHGLPVRMTQAGDPAIPAMLRAVAWLRTRLPQYPIYHGFLNDDFIPGATWASPATSEVAKQIRCVACTIVLMDGRLSFTTHHRATLYDLDYVARTTIEKPDFGPTGIPHPLWQKPNVILAPQFDADVDHAELIAQLALEAFGAATVDFDLGTSRDSERPSPDIEIIKRSGGPLLPKLQYP